MRRIALVACAAFGWTNCLDPTEVMTTITTDAKCSDVKEVSIVVGTLAQIEAPAGMITTSTKACANGRIGTLALVPPTTPTNEPAAIRVVLGLGNKTADDCVASKYKGGCIVARRAIRYVKHTKLELPIALTLDCVDVPCDATSTCLKGNCVPADTACDTDASGCGADSGPPPTVLARALGGPGNDGVFAMARDGSGNVFAAGQITGGGTLGGPNMVSGLSSQGAVFAASYDPALAFRWQYVPAMQNQLAAALTIAVGPNVSLGGFANGPSDWGKGPIGGAGTIAFETDHALLDGKFSTLRSWSGLGNLTRGVAYDASGNLYVVGTCAASAVNSKACSNTASDVFVTSFDPNGAHRWTQVFGNTNNLADSGWAIAVSGNRLVIGGSAGGPIDFGGGSRSGGGMDLFLASLSTADGTHIWSRVMGDTLQQYVQHVATDGTSVYAVGNFEGTMADQDVPSTVMSAGSFDAFLWKVALSDGKGELLQRFGGSGTDSGRGVDVDANRTAHVCGLFEGTANLGAGTVTANGMSDSFVTSVDAKGAASVLTFGSPTADGCYAIVVDSPSVLWLGGFFTNTLSLGAATITSAGMVDGYVLRVKR